MRTVTVLTLLGLASVLASCSSTPMRGSARMSAVLPSHGDLHAALAQARAADNGGFNLDMWGTIVDRDGAVQAVAFTGEARGDQWPGSRVISAQKANTANAFSLAGLALSTANLFAAVQPGGSLFGLQESNPVDVDVAYGGNARRFGQANDPMVGHRIGGVNVFGGGLGLYAPGGVLVGALGVSGDSSCADHNIAWRTRHLLGLDHVPAGVSGDATRPDNIVFDFSGTTSAGGFGHVNCIGGNEAREAELAGSLPVSRSSSDSRATGGSVLYVSGPDSHSCAGRARKLSGLRTPGRV